MQDVALRSAKDGPSINVMEHEPRAGSRTVFACSSQSWIRTGHLRCRAHFRAFSRAKMAADLMNRERKNSTGTDIAAAAVIVTIPRQSFGGLPHDRFLCEFLSNCVHNLYLREKKLTRKRKREKESFFSFVLKSKLLIFSSLLLSGLPGSLFIR